MMRWEGELALCASKTIVRNSKEEQRQGLVGHLGEERL